MGCPINLGIGFSGDQSPIRSVQHIEEAIFRRLHNDRSRHPLDLDICQYQMLRGRVVPTISGRGLVVPSIITRFRIKCDDARQKEIIPPSWTSNFTIPRRAVTDTDIEQSQRLVIRH